MAGERLERRLSAILAADVAGYSRLMGVDEEATHVQLKDHLRTLVEPKIVEHRGRVVKNTGDGMLAQFSSVVDALRCAVEVQRGMAARNSEVPQDKRIEFRVGINVGDVIIEENDIYGDGVNIAARLETLALPGGICVSARVQEDARSKLDLAFEDTGEHRLKNIAWPVRVYRVRLEGVEAKPLPTLALPDKPSIAVLPFQNLSGDPSQEYFADGIAEEITTALARLRGFFVIARGSAFTYKGRTVGVTQIGRELGVRYVLEGSVRRAGERVRIGVQLADAGTGREIWVERYERALPDLFALQDEVTASIVTAVEPQLYAAESARLQQTPPSHFDAWDCVIRALPFMWRWTRSDNETALDFLSAALRLDPSYARALGLHAWLSLWNAQAFGGGLAAVLAPATERARAAVAIDRNDPWARLAFGFSHMLRREHEEAVEELRAALDLNPNFALGHAFLGLVLAYGAKGAEAVGSLERAMRLSPHDPNFAAFASIRAFAHFMAGDYAAGLDWGRRAVRQNPEVTGSWRGLALSAAMLGHLEEAREAVAKARDLQPEYSVAWVERASPLIYAADRTRYCDILRPVGLPEE
ncbi:MULTISPECIES: adenylate/guanylate cyclase domain-containing protein [unclassified Bradyrhizobium]|uniref:adenylate/guanylate cyclase domain-containing protein n=1 Tax=unclassified Bradyrhizobium TaxID=2631580 RepID=UPI0024787998|nr:MULTISPECIES: adenylate/guanylate cyclase domain-containing protein [unclassified Bradyrhizobium]WGR71816.1 adenylate/guanylate cyclase domain-containing protein [Bradyrhizobium sp. ISRA426]WGR76651.1 adenylate/guanylate cyclase domain-containing protein [Bradyrhizobium sp. ISRA430]WGR87056.1 adenylate/guanylate cyclase domain-containing protein [Bradyrhizobium sp. ISRA432]